MSTLATILASVTKFITASDKAHAIVNGPASGEGSEVVVDSGVIPTHAKQSADFISKSIIIANFQISEEGNLMMTYSSETIPDFQINLDGDLILTI